jgi:enoyl-[acyl-carrier protein] reductase III
MPPTKRSGKIAWSRSGSVWWNSPARCVCLEAHIRQLALELAPAGITANAILAGVTDSPALRQIPDYERIMEIARERNPHKRLTQPEDVARCIAALAHPATYWLTGNTLQVDGGENIVG